MNRAGLFCGAFYFPTIAEYAPVIKEKSEQSYVAC